MRNAARRHHRLQPALALRLARDHCPGVWQEDEALAARSREAALNRLSDVCDVCGFGFYCPQLNHELVLEPNQFGRTVPMREGDTNASAPNRCSSSIIKSPKSLNDKSFDNIL